MAVVPAGFGSISPVAAGGDAHVFDVEATFGSGNIASFQNATVEKASVDWEGTFTGHDGIFAGKATVAETLAVVGNSSFGAALTGAFVNIQPGIVALDMITGVGMGLNIEADTWSINAAGNGETKAIGALAFLGIPTWTSVGTTFTITNAATAYIQGSPVGSTNVTLTNAYALWVDAGTSRFDGDIISGSAGSVNIGSAALPFNLISVGSANSAASGAVRISNNEGVVWRNAANGTDIVGLNVNASDVVELGGASLVAINDATNTNMTIGLTINQGAANNEILALKSSDVVHAMTGLTEADTFLSIVKAEATSGGARFRGWKDADGVAGAALQMNGILGEAADTTKTTAGRGVVEFIAQITDGGTSSTVVGADGNLAIIRNDATTRFIFDAEGTMHAVGASVVSTYGEALNALSPGPHAVGGAVANNFRMGFTGSFTSGGAGSEAAAFLVDGALTGFAADTGFLVGTQFNNSIVTQTETESIGVIAQVRIDEPAITDNLTGDITIAASLYIADAPGEGEENAALWIASGNLHHQAGAFIQELVTVLDDTGTPTIIAGNLFKTGGTTAITDFDNGVVGQTIKIISAHAITITDGSPIILDGSADFVMAAADTLTLTMFDDQVWQEVSRMVNL